jgi:hypothetical protein
MVERVILLLKAIQKLNAQYTQKRDYSVDDESGQSLRYSFY